jgi:putative transposase
MIFQPETVIGWQRAGFRFFWRLKSRHRTGRPGKDQELIELIRRMSSVNTTEAPTASWTAQQVINAFPYDTVPEYLLRDRDSIYRSVFVQRVEGMGIKQKMISPRSPWQSPYVERLIGSIRRECLDRVIVLHERQLHQILGSYLKYYHEVRPHQSLAHDSPVPRPVQSPEHGVVMEMPLVGGLHHQYLRQAA